MKKLFLFLSVLLLGFVFVSKINAQKAMEGIYLTADDFNHQKISYCNNSDKKYNLYLHEFLNSLTIKIVIGDSIIKLNKSSIFGYCDKYGKYYRYVNNQAYQILNPTDKILLYSKSVSIGGMKSSHTVVKYFFSAGANSSVIPLTKWNIKKAFPNEVAFWKLLDTYFQNDDELYSYDTTNQQYYLDHIYGLIK